MKGELTLPFPSGDPSLQGELADLPLVYIASPLTRVNTSSALRRGVTFEVDKIVSTIQDPRFDGAEPEFRTHAPAVQSAPWSNDATDWDIYRQNTLLVLAEADAIIILAHQGGSSGTGQELELATRRQIPILHLSPTDEAVSRQVTGNPLVSASTYQLPDELAEEVRSFIRDNRTAIEAGPARRRDTSMIYGPLQSDLMNKWRDLEVRRQGDVAKRAGTTPELVDHFLSHPLMLATLAHHQILQIGNGLGVNVTSYFTRYTGALVFKDIRALVSAQEEYGWNDRLTEQLLQHAEQVQMSEGVRRLKLSSPADWLRLREDIEL